MQTQLLEKASNLSGGQCQRLVIARALLRTDSAVYIFDEAASNIDVESEELIMNVIHELAKTKTVLLISHRLANVVKSDKIYFLKDGEIKESGKHDELMSRNGAYRYLYESQMALLRFVVFVFSLIMPFLLFHSFPVPSGFHTDVCTHHSGSSVRHAFRFL